ncbi:MAG TPA: tripartite tricarboxylate transporter substrate-binding protein [Burkholderiales bacterium]|nr:tripartite tricarboxylate transporter substrate-binding protein [Burkholderiales bacterium]
MLVENRAGASGSIGAEAVARAEPEGYTLLSTPPVPLVINPIPDAGLPCDRTQLVPAPMMAAIMKEDAGRWRQTIRAAGVNGVRR